MKFILDGGWYKKDKDSVDKNIFARYMDFLLENVKQGKKLLVITNAKPADYYKDRITSLVDNGAEVVDRDTERNIEWSKYDLIFTLGGNSKVLFDELVRLNFKIGNLKDSVLYIGSSAGAQIMASYFYDYDRDNKNISFLRGFLPESNILYMVHSDNTAYVDDFLKTNVQKFSEDKKLEVRLIKENEIIEK